MSWNYLPVSAHYQASGSRAGEPYAMWNGLNTRLQLLKQESGTGCLMMRQSGMMSELSTADPGADSLMSLRRAFLASRSACQENSLEVRIPETAGLTPFALLEKSDHKSPSWRIPQISFPFQGNGAGDRTSIPFSETWPESGMTQCGAAYRLPPLEAAINGVEYGLLPTPMARDGKSFYVVSKATSLKRLRALKLGLSKKQLHWMQYSVIYHGLKKGWANPLFSELMMELPIGWTDLQPLEMEKFLLWLRQHGIC